VEPTVLAQSLVEEFVEKIVVDAANDLHLDAETTARYETKIRLYQLAAVLMALFGEERKNRRFIAVREHFERNIFASSPDQGSQLLREVKTAMRDLNDVLTPAER